MFEKVRKPGRAKSIFAMVLFGAICMVFVFFGITPGRVGVMMGGSAATVNDSVITFADYNQAMRRTEGQYRSMLDSLPEAQRNYFEKNIRARALEELIMFELVASTSEREGLRIADGEVRTQILNIPAFQDNGKFSREKYDEVLEANHLQTSVFESKIRKELLLNRTEQLFLGAFKALPIEEAQQSLLHQSKLNLQFAHYTRDNFVSKVDVSNADITQFISAPENQAKLKKYYDDNHDKYSQPEQVQAAHILIKVDPADKSSEGKALAKVKEIAATAKADNFSQLASQFSQDEGSRSKGGDLGWFSRGRMVKEFEQAAFQLAPGKISEPVKTSFGYHLIFVKDHKASTSQPFEAAKSDVGRRLLAETRADEILADLEKAVKAGRLSDVQQALKVAGITFEAVGDASLDQPSWPKLADATGAVLDAVLDSGLKLGLVSKVIPNRGSNYIVQVLKVMAPNETAPVVPEKKSPDSERLASRRAYQLFDDWYRGEEKKARIVRNQQVQGEVAESVD